MTDLDKIKMEVEAARFEVVQAEIEITGIKLALRSVAAKAPQAGGVPEGAEDSSNSLLISAIRVRFCGDTSLILVHILQYTYSTASALNIIYSNVLHTTQHYTVMYWSMLDWNLNLVPLLFLS
jgi:hypothetical protein